MSHYTYRQNTGWSPFPEESDQLQGDTMLERIARAYEKAIDAAGAAYDAEAEAEALYLQLHSRAYAIASEDGVAATKRGEWCDNQPDVCEAKQDYKRAVGARNRCVLKATELEHRMMAAMSHQRFIREATGA